MPEFNELADLDPVARFKRSTELLTYHQDAVAELGRVRREALTELLSEGKTQRELGVLLGMTGSRIGQLLKSGERALLGSGPLTIAVGGKPEGPRLHGGTPSTVISAEATKARDLIAETARNYGLDIAPHETVDPPGIVDLNRPNLIVLNSPRLLPFLTQVLAADPHLGFGKGAQGWYLTANGTIYRSPCDRGEPSDYAYIGRLPRPDSKGTFLYVAGIHAMGTLGAATYLCENLAELYEQVKARRWSVLIECRFDPDTRQIQETRPITPVYTH